MKRIGATARALAHRRRRTALLAVILLITLAGSGGLLYYRSLGVRVRRDDGYYFPEQAIPDEEQTGASFHLPATNLDGVDRALLEQALRAWARTGDALEDRSVLNILLCGVDSRSGDARGGRSDAVMLVSVNRRRRTVVLTSFLRDSCSYIDLSKDPNNPRAELGRLSGAYSLGGPATLMETLSADYKIHIDDFVCVDFNSFPKLIDALGGVTLDVSRAGAGYINRTVPGVKGKFPWGEGVQLTGAQALLYSRVGQDDENRADHQRAVILAILERARQSSPGQVVKALGKTLRYVYTDLSEAEVDALAKDALTQGWLHYEVTQLRTPALPGGEERTTGLSADVDGRRVWIVDYPREAQRLQEAIYGHTNLLDGKGADYVAGLFE